jgi:hypothetical protein
MLAMNGAHAQEAPDFVERTANRPADKMYGS